MLMNTLEIKVLGKDFLTFMTHKMGLYRVH